MPHQCAECETIHPDGSEAVISSGCKDCGAKKFQFIPQDNSGSGSGSDGAGVALEDREWPETATRKSLDNSSNDESGSGSETASAGARESLDSMDDDAQANARSTIVDPGSLPSFSGGSESGEPSEPGDIIVADVDNDPVQDADEVREVLNDQFGSIKIVERGKFELDLMEMFESDDYIIQLGEDGRYMVESMSTWKPGNPDL